MEKIHNIAFSTDNCTVEEVKEEAVKAIEKAFDDAEKEAKLIDTKIVNLINTAKCSQNNPMFDKDADAFLDHMLKQSKETKRCFVEYYYRCMEEPLTDLVLLVAEQKELSLSKEASSKKDKIKIKTKNNLEENSSSLPKKPL